MRAETFPAKSALGGHCRGISMGKVQGVKFDLPQTMPGPSPPCFPAARPGGAPAFRPSGVRCASRSPSAPGLLLPSRSFCPRAPSALPASFCPGLLLPPVSFCAPPPAPSSPRPHLLPPGLLLRPPARLLPSQGFEAGGGTGAFGWGKHLLPPPLCAYFLPRASRRAAAPARSASVSPYFAIRGKYFFSRRLSLVERARRMLFRMAVRSSGCFLRMAL